MKKPTFKGILVGFDVTEIPGHKEHFLDEC